MSDTLLATKLYVPPPRPKVVVRSRLIAQLNEGLNRKLTLISAPAGFGKTTLVSEWVAECGRPAAWLSLDEGDNDPTRFLMYLVGALQTVLPTIGDGLLGMIQAPQPPPTEIILTALVNKVSAIPADFVLVLDDYHDIDAQAVDQAMSFLLDHQPPRMHLVIATREDPPLPLARWRARGQLTELRITDLRFTRAEAAGFLNQVMGLNLSPDDIATLETRTEGWIAGLQLAALSMQSHQDMASFIKSFTGSHRFILDYLMEEVLQQQPHAIQHFLLYTSVLNRMCGALAEAVLRDGSTDGQTTLEYLERANLFIVPLDNERRWYRYHHLFGDLLRQRLRAVAAEAGINDLHIRASQWYEDNGLDLEAFQHAAAANDVARAERLIGAKGIQLHLRGAVVAILDWLGSLPKAVLDERPALWWRYGSLLLVNGHTTGVDEKLDAAENALHGRDENDPEFRNLIGRIETARAVLSLTRYQIENMFAHSRRALEYLPADYYVNRANVMWVMGTAYFFAGDRAAARAALNESIAYSQAAGDMFTVILATVALGTLEEAETQLVQAAETYNRVLHIAGEQPLQIVSEAQIGLARVLYEWNDLAAAEHYGQLSVQLSRQYDFVIDRFIISEVFLARLKLAQGDADGAAAILAQASQTAQQRNFIYRIPEVAAAQAILFLHQGDGAAAAHLAQTHHLPLIQVRVHLAQGDSAAALAILEPLRQQAEAKHWQDELLKILVLQALAQGAQAERGRALGTLSAALELAERGGHIRLFVDEGQPMARLLSEALADGLMPDTVRKLLAAFAPTAPETLTTSTLVEPLSPRELEVLRLIAQGLSNHEIGAQLFLALDTVKGHNRRIFEKLNVQRRTEAVARARELGLL